MEYITVRDAVAQSSRTFHSWWPGVGGGVRGERGDDFVGGAGAYARVCMHKCPRHSQRHEHELNCEHPQQGSCEWGLRLGTPALVANQLLGTSVGTKVITLEPYVYQEPVTVPSKLYLPV